jgi:hypothetical protein
MACRFQSFAELQGANPVPAGFLLFGPLSQIFSRMKLRRSTKPLAAGWHLPGLALRLVPWTTNCILPCQFQRGASQQAVEISGNRCKSKKSKMVVSKRKFDNVLGDPLRKTPDGTLSDICFTTTRLAHNDWTLQRKGNFRSAPSVVPFVVLTASRNSRP